MKDFDFEIKTLVRRNKMKPTLDHGQGGSLTHPMLITTLFLVQPQDQ